MADHTDDQPDDTEQYDGVGDDSDLGPSEPSEEDSSSLFNNRRKAYTALALATVIIAGTGVAVALTFTSLATTDAELFGSDAQDTQLNISSYDTNITDKHAMEVTVVVKNEDATTNQTGNVTIQLLDRDENVIVQDVRDVTVTADGTTEYTVTFNDDYLAENFEETYIILEQRNTATA